jgi:hypothetical protein
MTARDVAIGLYFASTHCRLSVECLLGPILVLTKTSLRTTSSSAADNALSGDRLTVLRDRVVSGMGGNERHHRRVP